MAKQTRKSGAQTGKKQAAPATVAEEVEAAMTEGDANVDTADNAGNAPAAGADNAAAAAGAGPEADTHAGVDGQGRGPLPPAAEAGGQGAGTADAAPNAPDAGAAETEKAKAPIAAVIERIGEFHPGSFRVDLEGGYCFVAAFDKIPALAGIQLPENHPIEIAEDGQAIMLDPLPGYRDGVTVSLAKLKAAWEAENGEQLFPELEWPVEAVQRAAAKPRPEWAANVLAATFAASHAYGGAGEFAGVQVDTDAEFDDRFRTMMHVAASHVRSSPDAPANAIPIELKLTGFRDVPQSGLRVMAAWRVFAFTLRELDRLDAEEKALADQASKAAQPQQRPLARPGQMAMTPGDPPFSPTGFSPRR